MMLSKKSIKPCKLYQTPQKEEYMIRLELLRDLNSAKSKAAVEAVAVVISYLLKTFLTTFSMVMKCLNVAEDPDSSSRDNIVIKNIEEMKEVKQIPNNCSDNSALFSSLSL